MTKVIKSQEKKAQQNRNTYHSTATPQLWALRQLVPLKRWALSTELRCFTYKNRAIHIKWTNTCGNATNNDKNQGRNEKETENEQSKRESEG
jgi:hypothetical protein